MTEHSPSPKGNKRKAAPAQERAYHHGDLRRAIVAAALEVLVRSEPSALSLRDLARTVGVRHSALYTHFRDREELLAVIAGEGFKALETEMQAALASAPGDGLEAIASAYLAFARSNAGHYRTMFRSENVLVENITHVEEPSYRCFQMLVDTVAAKGVPDREAAERSVGIWSTMHGLVLLGENSGPLHQKLPSANEDVLARKFVRVLASGSWPSDDLK